MKVCKRCVVAGKVQGVFFRQGTADQAKTLKITGWVRNLSDGDVEAVIWLHRGPDAAIVEDLTIEELAWEEHPNFEIR